MQKTIVSLYSSNWKLKFQLTILSKCKNENMKIRNEKVINK